MQSSLPLPKSHISLLSYIKAIKVSPECFDGILVDT